MSLKGHKFILARGEGSISSTTPLLDAELIEIEKPQEEVIIPEETDPTVPTHVKNITANDVLNWTTGFNNNLISGSVTGDENKMLTLTKRDGSVLQIPFTDLAGLSADDVINTLNFNINTGVMTAVTSEGVQITTNLDGRYSLLGHTHSWNQITEKPTFDNYDGWNLKTNGTQRIKVVSGGTADFVAGEKISITYGAGGKINIAVVKKTTKVVSASTYTITSTDQYRWLVFAVNCTVTIPTGLLIDDLFEGEADTGATVIFQAASGVALRHVESVSKTLSPNGVFGIRFKANNNCVLYGTDPTNYVG